MYEKHIMDNEIAVAFQQFTWFNEHNIFMLSLEYDPRVIYKLFIL